MLSVLLLLLLGARRVVGAFITTAIATANTTANTPTIAGLHHDLSRIYSLLQVWLVNDGFIIRAKS